MFVLLGDIRSGLFGSGELVEDDRRSHSGGGGRGEPDVRYEHSDELVGMDGKRGVGEPMGDAVGWEVSDPCGWGAANMTF